MRRLIWLLIVGVISVALGSLLAAEDSAFKVVVNSSNPVSSMTRSQLSRLFLKQETAWPNGQAVIPVDLVESSAVRASFSQSIHRRDVGAIKSYWQRMIFSGTAVPPVEKASNDEVIAMVKASPGVVGYVAPNTTLPEGTKVLQVID